MSQAALIRVTEPRLGSITHRSFHLFRLALLGGFGFWLVFFSPAETPLTRALVTAALLVCLWFSWQFAKRWSDTALVLELTPENLRYSLLARQPLRSLALSDIDQIQYHLHLLLIHTRDGRQYPLHFPLKHRHYLPRLRQALAELLPEVAQSRF